MKNTNRTKWAIRGLVVAILVVATILIATVISRWGKVGVAVYKVPNDATVLIEGIRMDGSTIYLKPGTVSITVQKDGFAQKTFKQTISSNRTDQSIIASLDPISDAAKQWATDNAQKYLDIEGIFGEKIATRGEENYTRHPVLESLPYSSASGPFTIDYWFDDNNTPYLIVSNSTAPGRRAALKWILNHNNNTLSDMVIRFEDNSSIGGIVQ